MLKKIVITIEIGDDDALAHTICQDVLSAATKRRGAASINVTEIVNGKPQAVGGTVREPYDNPSDVYVPGNETPVDSILPPLGWECRHCGRGCGSGRSKGVHETRCKLNPNRKTWSRKGTKNSTAATLQIADTREELDAAPKIPVQKVRMTPGTRTFSLKEGEQVSTCCSAPMEKCDRSFAPGGTVLVSNRCTFCMRPCFWKKFTTKPKPKKEKRGRKNKRPEGSGLFGYPQDE